MFQDLNQLYQKLGGLKGQLRLVHIMNDSCQKRSVGVLNLMCVVFNQTEWRERFVRRCIFSQTNILFRWRNSRLLAWETYCLAILCLFLLLFTGANYVTSRCKARLCLGLKGNLSTTTRHNCLVRKILQISVPDLEKSV